MDNKEIEKEILEEKKSISHLRLFLIFIVIAVAGGFISFYYGEKAHQGRQMEDSSVFDTRLQNVENTVALHEKRLAKLEEDAAKIAKALPATGGQVPPDVNDRLAAVEKTIGSLKVSSSPQTSAQLLQAITLLSSFYRLSNDIVAGKPFAADLSSFQEKYGSDDKSLSDILAPLLPYADSGIPTTSTLLSSFDDAVAALKKNEAQPPENAGLWNKLVFNIAHLISIRRIDKTQAGNSVDAVIGRAEDDLDDDEVEAAMAEIKSLPDNARNSFAAWLEDAQVTTLAPSYVAQIEEKVMKKAFAGSSSTNE